MKRLGMWTGRIYVTDGHEFPKTGECTVPITDEQAADEQYIADKYKLLHSYWCVERNCTYCLEWRQKITVA